MMPKVTLPPPLYEIGGDAVAEGRAVVFVISSASLPAFRAIPRCGSAAGGGQQGDDAQGDDASPSTDPPAVIMADGCEVGPEGD